MQYTVIGYVFAALHLFSISIQLW